jgi:hypothetical protein
MVSLEATGNIFRRAYTGKPMRLWSCTNKSITFKANGGREATDETRIYLCAKVRVRATIGILLPRC